MRNPAPRPTIVVPYPFPYPRLAKQLDFQGIPGPGAYIYAEFDGRRPKRLVIKVIGD